MDLVVFQRYIVNSEVLVAGTGIYNEARERSEAFLPYNK